MAATSSASKKRSATVFSRDEIGVEQLQSLKEKFADGDLNEKEFVSLFREIIDSSLSETQLTELFQKIDANSDGTVDWDELTNYMFLSGSDNSSEFIGDDSATFYETSQAEKIGDVAHGDSGSGGGGGASEGSAVRPQHHHKDVITRVLRLEKPYVYVTASKDGSVRTWNANTMAFQSTITTGKNWLTDCCVMRRSNRLAVASMNRTLGFYDLSSGQLIGEITEYSKRQCIPLCLEYVEKPADDREALVVGDDTGGITVMTCSGQWLACDGRSTTSTGGSSAAGSSGSGANNPTNAAGSASLEANGFSSRTKFKKHTDWVTRVKWVNDIRAVVATSLDTNISIIDIDRMVVKFEYNRHKKGVFDLVWCSSTRLIASCGMERDISIWNPYSSQRAVGTLRGHTSSVLHLASDDDNYQIISAASDNTFKVWDVRNHRCLQTFVDRYKSTGGSENRISALLYDPKSPCLVSATTHLTRWPFKVQPDEEQEDETKERPMCIASYNSVFHQVVTAEMSSDSIVKTWSAETGDEICSFANAHRQSPVTAISFDYPGRRLLTGGHDGNFLKMWNFSNGALVKQFLKHEESSSLAAAPTASSSQSSTVASASSSSAASTVPSSLSNTIGGVDADAGGAALAASPVKRRVRDIVTLPASFGVDQEGRRGGPIAGADLPSPTRVRLERGRDVLTPREPATSRKWSVNTEADRITADSSAAAPVSPSRGPTSGPSSGFPSPRPAKCRYRQQEVTSILDIERNLRVGMGDFICQRFVCSVGWDCNIFVWADKNDESEALPVHVLPNKRTLASNPTKCHSTDILALVYIPPAYIATAGLDGKILLWSLNSGEYVSKLHQSAGSIDAMFYAQKLELLLASGESGQLVCIDRSMATQAVLKLEHPKNESITALRCDKTNTHLVTGDAAGFVKLWDLSISPEHEGVVLEYCCHWRLGAARVLCADFVENARVSEVYLLLACGNGDVSLWTLDGVLVGCFGRHHAWQLGRPATYASRVSSCVPPEPHAEAQQQKYFIRCYSIASLSSSGGDAKETFLLEDSMPKPGEVWTCVSGHRTRVMTMNAKKQDSSGVGQSTVGTGSPSGVTSSTMTKGTSGLTIVRRDSSAAIGSSSNNNDNNGGGEPATLASLAILQQKLAENISDVTELITVVKVTRGEISCWDGNGCKTPVLRVLEMSDFVRKAGWTTHALLSQFIGRTFLDDQGCFRVNAISLNTVDASKPNRKAYALIDTNGVEHSLRPLNCAISIARLKLQDAFVAAHNQAQAARLASSAKSSPRRRTLVPVANTVGDASPMPPMQSLRHGKDGDVGVGLPSALAPPSLASANGPAVSNVALLTTSSVGMGARTLPLIKPREKRDMGGLLPKRSSVRTRHDQSVDFRRIHNPEDVPKNFRVFMQQKTPVRAAAASSVAPPSSTSTSSRAAARSFDGVLPG
ncbi:hypothetical protein PybrP1_011465 [[Pythium] brassicae (nom. inval.)]|nr:hypothetical protein PybrP1_011465 [[Pythium] brassicae (nom. inval.)]